MKTMEITFARNLVKGKIAETVFAQMLRSTGQFTVLEFGYEKIIPELVGRGKSENDEMVEALRTAPDFAVINNKTKEVHLIEVKYRHNFSNSAVLSIAKRMSASWNPSYLFVATVEGFYFGEVRDIIKRKGKIDLLNHPQISKKTQENFLKILNDFES
ncbi:hypothetical protein H6781_02310 [Candidatus Nomurabacteria bacterium]|nr:hypothetical protein [Candidatus Nomurabacteria bacterium]MCB9818011.1 hypothetical protein [Candidatus Nomurabacteria bacterium]